MTQSPANNVVEVNPAPNIYTVLMIIAILALVITICFAGNRLMSRTNPNGDWSIHGGYGLMQEYDVERFYRDHKLLEIGEGTSEIQRIVISRHIGCR